jgi:hypothetical protein
MSKGCARNLKFFGGADHTVKVISGDVGPKAAFSIKIACMFGSLRNRNKYSEET